MEACEKLEACPFFKDQMDQMPAVAGLMKKTYCQGDKTKCARYHVSKAGLSVPRDLMPNDTERASTLIASRN